MRLTKTLIAASAAISLGNAPVGLSAQITPPSEPYPIVASTSPDVSASANAPRDIVVDGVTYTIKPETKPVTTPAPVVVSPAVSTQNHIHAQGGRASEFYSGEATSEISDTFLKFGAGLYQFESSQLSYLLWNYVGTDIDKIDMGGIVFGGGFYLAPSEIGRARFDFEVGFYFQQEDYPFGGYYNADVFYMAAPLLISPSYEFGTSKARFRLGPVFGVTAIHLSIETPYGDADDTAFVFTYGGNMGFSYVLSEQCKIDISYRILYNTNGEMNLKLESGDFSSSAHQLNFTIGWRF
jgi:opacity protein-like surface antigen